jgi:hypothetical protein
MKSTAGYGAVTTEIFDQYKLISLVQHHAAFHNTQSPMRGGGYTSLPDLELEIYQEIYHVCLSKRGLIDNKYVDLLIVDVPITYYFVYEMSFNHVFSASSQQRAPVLENLRNFWMVLEQPTRIGGWWKILAFEQDMAK